VSSTKGGTVKPNRTKPRPEAPEAFPEVMVTSEAAAFLQCSTQHLEIARVKGDGPPFSKLGRRLVRYRKSTLLAWLAKHEVTSTSAEPPK
jgi:predicted DNA-binding transcriptional regulator AlpA